MDLFSSDDFNRLKEITNKNKTFNEFFEYTGRFHVILSIIRTVQHDRTNVEVSLQEK